MLLKQQRVGSCCWQLCRCQLFNETSSLAPRPAVLAPGSLSKPGIPMHVQCTKRLRVGQWSSLPPRLSQSAHTGFIYRCRRQVSSLLRKKTDRHGNRGGLPPQEATPGVNPAPYFALVDGRSAAPPARALPEPKGPGLWRRQGTQTRRARRHTAPHIRSARRTATRHISPPRSRWRGTALPTAHHARRPDASPAHEERFAEERCAPPRSMLRLVRRVGNPGGRK